MSDKAGAGPFLAHLQAAAADKLVGVQHINGPHVLSLTHPLQFTLLPGFQNSKQPRWLLVFKKSARIDQGEFTDMNKLGEFNQNPPIHSQLLTRNL